MKLWKDGLVDESLPPGISAEEMFRGLIFIGMLIVGGLIVLITMGAWNSFQNSPWMDRQSHPERYYRVVSISKMNSVSPRITLEKQSLSYNAVCDASSDCGSFKVGERYALKELSGVAGVALSVKMAFT